MGLPIFSDILLQSSSAPEGLYKMLLSMHSGWRYIILILMIAAIIFGRQAAKGKRGFAGAPRRFGMFTMIAADIQLLLGLGLYSFFLKANTSAIGSSFGDQMSNSSFRNIAVEHALGMIIALVLIHIGYARAKKNTDSAGAGKAQFTYYLIALIIILVSIPWPFLHAGRGWF